MFLCKLKQTLFLQLVYERHLTHLLLKGFSKQDHEHIYNRWFVLQELQDRVVEALDLNVDLMSLGREIVDFHGEMVLLENYSALNYTGMLCSKTSYMKARIHQLVFNGYILVEV